MDTGFRSREPGRLTYRMYLTLKAMEVGADFSLAAEAVASTAIEHPEWDMDERATLDEWEQRAKARRAGLQSR